MSNRFIITEYKNWSKFGHANFNKIYENTPGATGSGATGATGATGPAATPTTTVPEELQTADTQQKANEELDRGCNWMVVAKSDGNKEVLYIKEEKTADSTSFTLLAGDKAKAEAVSKFSTGLSTIRVQGGGFDKTKAIGSYYFGSLGGSYNVYVAKDDHCFYLKQVLGQGTTGSSLTANASADSMGEYYTVEWVRDENFANSGILMVWKKLASGKLEKKGYLQPDTGGEDYVFIKFLSQTGSWEPKALSDGPRYFVNANRIITFANNLWNAMSGGGTDPFLINGTLTDMQPLEFLVLERLWTSNAWSTPAGTLSKLDPRISNASDFAKFANATPVYDQADVDTNDPMSSSDDIVEYFPSAKTPSLLLDLFWEMEDHYDERQLAMTTQLDRLIGGLVNEKEADYAKPFQIEEEQSGNIIINTQEDILELKGIKGLSIIELGKMLQNEASGYKLSEYWKD
jgi:hypothetical protein